VSATAAERSVTLPFLPERRWQAPARAIQRIDLREPRQEARGAGSTGEESGASMRLLQGRGQDHVFTAAREQGLAAEAARPD